MIPKPFAHPFAPGETSKVPVGDPGELTLGKAGHGVIWLDDNAAGWGWFVDRTPRSDLEFTQRGNQGEQNRMDLLTVVTHEVGHLLGYEHTSVGVMQDTLDAGIRRTPGSQPITAANQHDAALTWFGWTADTPWNDHGHVSVRGRNR
jgi:hypothetical protein